MFDNIKVPLVVILQANPTFTQLMFEKQGLSEWHSQGENLNKIHI